MSITNVGLLIAVTTVCLTLSPVASRTTQREDNSLLKALLTLKDSPELAKERLFAETLLQTEDTPNSLYRERRSNDIMNQYHIHSSSEHQRSGRQKRTIGFLTRLGACVMTFMSNPTCWQRLTRTQIAFEQNRQLAVQQQEQDRRFLEQKIYQGYLTTLLNGTNSTTGTNSTLPTKSITVPLLNYPTTALLAGPTTPRPLLFPMGRRLMSALFPRLYAMLNPNQNQNTQSGYYSTNSLTTRQDPQYKNLF